MKEIMHLHWRAGFGLNPVEWREKQSLSLRECIEIMFEKAATHRNLPIPDLPARTDRNRTVEDKKELMKASRQLALKQVIDWLDRMGNTQYSALRQKMTLFWHGHFACITKNGILAARQIDTLQKHALGNFRDLLLGVAKDPSMIRFLNNQQNRKSQPNENFARELLELFTVGHGEYSEKDIKEAARAFTGWSSTRNGQFIFRERQHDFGSKTFMGQTGAFDGTNIIDIILENEATATFVTRKIYRYFVNEKVDETRVRNLSRLFYQSGYDIAILMRAIFESNWFYAQDNIGCKIKSPVELLAGMKRSLGVTFENDLAVLGVLRSLGQVPLNPPNVAGWPGGRSWIDNSTLMFRLNLPIYLMRASEVNLRPKTDLNSSTRMKRLKKIAATVDFVPIESMLDGKSQQESFEFLLNWLVPGNRSFDKQYFDPFIRKMETKSYHQALTMLLMSLPEYQLC